MKSLAIVFRKPNTPQLEDVEIPTLQADEVRVRTHYSGVSVGTERSIFSGARTDNGNFPLVGGYMASGTIEAVGSACKTWHVGQRVVTHTSRLDGPVRAVWGGHAAIQTTHKSLVTEIPQGLSDQDASMFILPCVSFNAVNIAKINEHDTVLIQGMGLIGQMFGQAARLRGARVIAIEPNPFRTKLAKQYVTPNVLAPEEADVQTVRKISGGTGPNVIVEATGVANLIGTLAEHLTNLSRFVFLAWYPGAIQLQYQTFHAKGATVLFPTGSGGPDVFKTVLNEMQQGNLVIGENLTHSFSSDESVKAYQKLITGDPEVMGMTIDWSSN